MLRRIGAGGSRKIAVVFVSHMERKRFERDDKIPKRVATEIRPSAHQILSYLSTFEQDRKEQETGWKQALPCKKKYF